MKRFGAGARRKLCPVMAAMVALVAVGLTNSQTDYWREK